MKKTLLALIFSSILTACGGGGSEPSTSSPLNSAPVQSTNSAWEQARVYLPYTQQPVSVKELTNIGPNPIAISLHGCDGIQDQNLQLGDKYYPIFLAQQGYLVIEPNSYPGQKQNDPGTSLCYFDEVKGITVYPATSFDLDRRKTDAEYAIQKISQSNFWDRKNLLVQGQSQGFFISYDLNPTQTKPVTRWLLSGGTIRCPTIPNNYQFLNNQPTLIVNSDADISSQTCMELLVTQYLNVKISLLKGNFHTPIFAKEGQDIIKEFIRLN